MRPVESTNRRRITSPSTFWSYSRGGYWIGESGFRATGGSWSGGTPGDPLPDCSAGGAWRHPAAPTLRRPTNATGRSLMVPPRVASSTPRADSTRQAATACSRRVDRALPAADGGSGFPTGRTGRAGPRRGVRAEAGAPHDDPLRGARVPARPAPGPAREVLPAAPD